MLGSPARPGRLLLFLVDLSGSMGGALMALAQRVALGVLEHAYVKRDRVAMIAFRAGTAELLFGPTDRVQRVQRELQAPPLGGTTPLGAGLSLAHQTLTQAARRDQAEAQTLVLISDGQANVSTRPGYPAVLAEVMAAAGGLARIEALRVVFLDTTERGKHDGPARALARQLRA
ncbi:MAG: VWA domain-containing protein, partial [Candidatus Eisenbacteria bacterium]|nr:VWA domain-containing protein [Candidatus Eisenbacteria bacterium]